MKNPRIQNMMIEKAKAMGGEDYYGTLKSMLSNKRIQTPFEGYIQKQSEKSN